MVFQGQYHAQVCSNMLEYFKVFHLIHYVLVRVSIYINHTP